MIDLTDEALPSRKRKAPEHEDTFTRDQRVLQPAYVVTTRVERFKVTNQDSNPVGSDQVKCLAVPAVLSFGRVVSGEEDKLEWRNFAKGSSPRTLSIRSRNHSRIHTDSRHFPSNRERDERGCARQGRDNYLARLSSPLRRIGGDFIVSGCRLYRRRSPERVLTHGSQVSFVGKVSVECHADTVLLARLLPAMVLDAPCALLEAEGHYIMAITALGTIAVWYDVSVPFQQKIDAHASVAACRNTQTRQSLFPSLNLSTLLLSASPAHTTISVPTITTSAILPNGSPLLALSTGATYSYDGGLTAWVRLSDKWWSTGSEAWEHRRERGKSIAVNGSAAARGGVRGVESAINEIVMSDEKAKEAEDVEESSSENENAELVPVEGDQPTRSKKRRVVPETIPTGVAVEELGNATELQLSLTLGHLEERMHATIVLDSPAEYKAALAAYCKKLAEEGYTSKAEELIMEMMGPIY